MALVAKRRYFSRYLGIIRKPLDHSLEDTLSAISH